MKRTPLKRHTPLKRSAVDRRKPKRTRGLRVVNPSKIKRARQLKRTRLKRSKPPALPQWVLDWWEWVRAQPCVICEQTREDIRHALGDDPADQWAQLTKTEVAHVGPRGLRQKCDPREVVPLCGVLHHRLGAYSAHRRGKEFWKFHGLIRKQVVRELQERYQRDTGIDLASFGKRLRPDFTAFDQEGHR